MLLGHALSQLVEDTIVRLDAKIYQSQEIMPISHMKNSGTFKIKAANSERLGLYKIN